jgi:hypothetical protein
MNNVQAFETERNAASIAKHDLPNSNEQERSRYIHDMV